VGVEVVYGHEDDERHILNPDDSPPGAVHEVLVSLSLLARAKHFAAPPCRAPRALSGARYARSGAASRTAARQGFRERKSKNAVGRAGVIPITHPSHTCVISMTPPAAAAPGGDRLAGKAWAPEM